MILLEAGRGTSLFIVPVDAMGRVKAIRGPFPTDGYAVSVYANPGNSSLYVVCRRRILTYHLPNRRPPEKIGSLALGSESTANVTPAIARNGKSMFLAVSDHLDTDKSWTNLDFVKLDSDGAIKNLVDYNMPEEDGYASVVCGPAATVYVAAQRVIGYGLQQEGKLTVLGVKDLPQMNVPIVNYSPKYGLIVAGFKILIFSLTKDGKFADEPTRVVPLPEEFYATCVESDKQQTLYAWGHTQSRTGFGPDELISYDLSGDRPRRIGKPLPLKNEISLAHPIGS